MYNSEQKKEYIDTESRYSSVKNESVFVTKANRLFTLTEKYENEFGYDFAEFNRDQLIETMKNVLSGGSTYQSGSLQLFKNYISWCIKNNRCSKNENHLNGLVLSKLETLNGYKNTSFESEDDFYDFLDNNFNDLNLNTTDNLIRCFCVLLFEGLIVEDAIGLKDSDVNFKTGVISLPSKKITLSSRALKVVKYVAHMSEIVSISSTAPSDYNQPINDYGYIIETSSNNDDASTDKYRYGGFLDYLIARVSAKSKDFESKNITPLKLLDCGVFVRAHKKEKETGEIDLIEFLKQRMERGNKTALINPEVVLAQGDLEYQKWKAAFNL